LYAAIIAGRTLVVDVDKGIQFAHKAEQILIEACVLWGEPQKIK